MAATKLQRLDVQTIRAQAQKFLDEGDTPSLNALVNAVVESRESIAPPPERKRTSATVKVERNLYEQIKAYSEVTGVPVSRVVHEALLDFVKTSMEARLEALQTNRPQVLQAVPRGPSIQPSASQDA